MSNNNKFITAVATIGTVLEWAEFSFYGYMAVRIAEIFFPQSDPQVGVLQAFGIFALGYIVRPLGAIFFGHIGDRYGRNIALMGSLILMGFSTFFIGCLPGYVELGLFSPALLLLLRMLQSLSISGEYNGAGIFLIETHQYKKPCLAGSWVSTAAAFGMVLGGLTAFIVSLPMLPEWSWRVPFLLGGLLCFVSIGLRKKFIHTQPRPAIAIKEKIPFITVLKTHKRALVFTTAIGAFTGIYFYVCNIYMVVFIQQYAHVSLNQATFYAIYAELIVMLLIPLMAYWADLTCPYRLYRISLLCAAVAAPIIFILASSRNPLFISLGMVLFGLTNAAICGPMVKLVYDQFPHHLRYTGVSFGWSLAAAFFSGTAPMVAQFLANQCQWPMGPSLYVTLAALTTYFITQVSRKYPVSRLANVSGVSS